MYNIEKYAEMTDDNKCIKCSDDEHIKEDFGYNKLLERYKCCLKCRERRKLKKCLVIANDLNQN